MKKKPGWFYCETWLQNFYFFVGWKAEDAEAYILKQWGVGGLNLSLKGGMAMHFSSAGRSIFALWTPTKPKNPHDHGTIAHEAAHLAGMCLENAGVKADWANDEPFTYLVALITRKLYEQL